MTIGALFSRYRTWLLICGLVIAAGASSYAQTTPTPAPTPPPSATEQIDSLRRLDENGKDTVIFTSKYIRYTKLRFLDDSTYTVPLDTTLRGFQDYNPLYRPESPTTNLGNLGLSARDMIFSPRKNLGFDAGFHALDRYVFTQDSVTYYRARTPFTELFYINGNGPEQLFTLTHTQNIRPNWNFGAVYKRIGANGYYQSQRGDHTNVSLSTWYQSNNKRYNLLMNGLFNTLKAGENGGALNDTLFSPNYSALGPRIAEATYLTGRTANRPAQSWKGREFFMKHFYYFGRIDSLNGDSSSAVLPTQRVAYTFSYSTNQYKFFKDEADNYGAFPASVPLGTVLTKDSTRVTNLRNEFMYSFYLRGRSVSFLKNEVKLDVGIRHDLYTYRQMGYSRNFQSTLLQANGGYRFSDRVSLTANLQQVAQGPYLGDFLYEARSSILLGRAVGRIVFGAYQLNRSPEEVFERVNYQYQQWSLSFDRTKTTALSFAYENEPLQFKVKGEYLLLSDYLYLQETPMVKQVIPVQASNPINLLKISVNKNFAFGYFHLDNFGVYQESDFRDVLRVPRVYVYSSFYYSKRLIPNIHSDIGIDARFNTAYAAPSYAINISQFYNGSEQQFSSYPVIDVWLKASLRRANVFLKYNYINQGLFSRGYYTVNRYPMPDKLFTFGVKWAFYN